MKEKYFHKSIEKVKVEEEEGYRGGESGRRGGEGRERERERQKEIERAGGGVREGGKDGGVWKLGEWPYFKSLGIISKSFIRLARSVSNINEIPESYYITAIIAWCVLYL